MNGLMHCNKRRAWVVMILLDHVVDAQQDRDRQFDAGRQVFSMRGPDSYPFHIHRDRREGPYVALGDHISSCRLVFFEAIGG